jgi:hypothetical protein
MRRLILVALLGILTTTGVADARGLRAPSLQSPRNGVSVQALPTFEWAAVTKATAYQFQLAADPHFGAIVQSGFGKGSIETSNTAATLEKAVPDGTYYWRVRSIAGKSSGPWSPPRKLVKAWTSPPQPLGPNGTTVSWPAQPLVFSWGSVPYAVKYQLTVATDPSLANQVIGTAQSPIITQGTVLSPSAPLRAGTYFWAVTPLDAQGHKGTPSQVASFTYAWPTTTTTTASYLNAEQLLEDDPQFSWSPIAGAARYEVEVNSAEGFPPGSKWCCAGTTIGTSIDPMRPLANNRYYWRVRAIDPKGNPGVWNYGAPFRKTFDGSSPSIKNLVVRDAEGRVLSKYHETGPQIVPTTDTPIVTWDPVPGASRYEVQLGPYSSELGCDWSLVRFAQYSYLHAETSATAWTPLGASKGFSIGPGGWPAPQEYIPYSLPALGHEYCVRVLARADEDVQNKQVVSTWTYLNPVPNQPAFAYADPPATKPPEGPLETSASDYLFPSALAAKHAIGVPCESQPCPRTPLFTWRRVAGAQGYFVVIAYDENFTEVADIGFTNVPAYAPHLANREPLADETTSYYWAVIPTAHTDGTEFSGDPGSGQDSPQTFNKSSIPPAPLAPASGAVVSNQPTFAWTPAENARSYRLQVAQDPSFGNPLEDVTTDATAYTSTSTYPADTVLYWRVRANDSIGQGLNWSPVRTFVRTLPAPVPSPNNATGGEAIPVLDWSTVPGAIGYDLHIEEVSGQPANFSFPAAAATLIEWYGVGVWRWQVRAEYPAAGPGLTTPSGYSAPQLFVRTLNAPKGAVGVKSGRRLVISWNPDPAAKQYQVDLSTTDGFTSTIDSHRIDNTSWAPALNLALAQNRGALFWRVAAVDGAGNVGTFVAGGFGRPRAACVSSRGAQKGKRGHGPVKRVATCVKQRHAKKHHK